MTQLSYTKKVAQLKELANSNFTNRTMFMLTGIEDILTQKWYKDSRYWYNDYRYYIDMTYDIAMPELAMNPEKPSKALTALAFNEAFRPKDYQRLVEASKKASSTELKEFLTQEVDHEPKEKVINYLSFPLLAMMTQHLKPWEATDIFLIEPNLIKDCIPEIRSKTFKELMNENTYLLLQRKAPKELQEDLKISDKTPDACCGAISFIDEDSFKGEIVTRLDTRILGVGSHWVDVRKARVSTHQTGTAAKIQQWLENNRTHS